MLGRPKCLHSFVETDNLSGGGGEGRMTHQTRKVRHSCLLKEKHIAPSHFLPKQLNTAMNVTIFISFETLPTFSRSGSHTQISQKFDTYCENESYLQNMAYPFIFSAHKLMLNKFCTDFVDVSMKFEYIEASPKLSDIPRSTTHLIRLLGLFRQTFTFRPIFLLDHPSLSRHCPIEISPFPTPLDDFILSVGDSREDNDHVIDQAESTLPPSLQLDNELKEESTLLIVLALILPSSLKTVRIGEVIDEVNKGNTDEHGVLHSSFRPDYSVGQITTSVSSLA
ncbi:hypothetical protein BLNAU_23837 [Blattamonas nauphoetae]|uniref:Uncharacterized protein n=1 Tax=Blattamonas nauphoetae TaxID=2049346 RepID=A0ABQ9WP54_9EUKA|nr:hypothetical protein BLNAU_23837 [Blattamonas nauphoetae]